MAYGYANMEKQRQRLPVYKYRTEILYLVENHATTIIVGETGSGKTTQIPQFLKEAGWAEGGRVIACTQPRRLAVQAVSARVAEEMGVNLGDEVGYTIRFEDHTTSMKLTSDLFQPTFYWKRQAPEGSTHGPKLEPAILSVEGRGFSVKIHYVEEPVSDYIRSVVSTILLINEREPPGDVLVFLTGQDDIETAIKLLAEEAHSNQKNSSGLLPLPLYSGLSRSEQELIFTPTPRGKRKISDIESLVVAPISKASARQRSGRAGRVRPGKCYRLYTEDYFLKQMPGEGIPEMQRSNLVSTVIQLKALGIDNILGFDWPAPPSPQAMIRALEVLYSLQILDDDAKLTSPTGFQVAELPLDPMISKMILASSELGCSDEIITIAAVLSIQSVWVIARGVQKEQDEAKLRFAAAEGDHVTFLNVYKGFLESKKSSQWCYKNFLNYQSMKKVVEIRDQLKRIARRLGITLKSCDGDMEAVRKAVTAGFFANACRLEPHSNGVYKTIRGSEEVYIHPSSVLFRVNPKWVVYQSIVSTERQYMRNVVTINPSWLTEVAPHFYQNRQNAMDL
ncbi:unnamed protein product [Thlaspi arvense]|uniref:RNA helicase n=1 Tax=Thlaspi arvense TaxID=13288 RepID=A0AAU9T7J9_THLAR|nr:unnamed protein product [Thlaspi arvense]